MKRSSFYIHVIQGAKDIYLNIIIVPNQMNSKKLILLLLYIFLIFSNISSHGSAKTSSLTLTEYSSPSNDSFSFEVKANISSTNLETGEHTVYVYIKIKNQAERVNLASRGPFLTKIRIYNSNKDHYYFTKVIGTMFGFYYPISFNYDQSWGKVSLNIELFWTELYYTRPYEINCETYPRSLFTLRTSSYFPIYVYVIAGLAIMGAIGSFFFFRRRKRKN